MIEHWLKEKIYKVTFTTDEFGDREPTDREELQGRIREFSALERARQMEGVATDAMGWLKTEVEIAEGDILQKDNVYYRVLGMKNAVKPGETQIRFKKLDLQREEGIIS